VRNGWNIVLGSYWLGTCCPIFILFGLIYRRRGESIRSGRYFIASIVCLGNIVLIQQGITGWAAWKLLSISSLPFVSLLMWQAVDDLTVSFDSKPSSLDNFEDI